jgi:hypothetical protein
MHISNPLVFLRWPRSDGATSRTAVYRPVRTVVWQGSAGNRCPYADQIAISLHPTVSELIPTLLSDLKPLA